MGLINVNTPQDGDTANASSVANPLNTIVSEFNGNIESVNLANNAVTNSKLANNSVSTANLQDGAIETVTTNSDGTSVRFVDGTQICTHLINMGAGNVNGNGSLANMYRSGTENWIFPQEFDSAPQVTALAGTESGGGAGAFATAAITVAAGTTSVQFQAFRGTDSSADIFVRATAIGRWK